MTRFAKFTAPLFAVALLLGITALTQADDEMEEGITLEGVNLGSHVLGPEMTADDLKGKVVVMEYWGDRCPPCIRAIPGLVEMRGEYDTEKLAIIANQVWTKDAAQTQKAWEGAGGDASITVVNHGGLKGAEVRGVPHAFVMDHNGKMIWRGHPANKEMKEVVANAVAALPSKS